MQGLCGGVIRIVSMVGLVLWLASPLWADDPANPDVGTHMKVSGTVTKVKSGMVFVKTPWGQVTFSVGDAPKEIKAGEDIEMIVNENNVVIDVHRKGDSVHHHRHITGKLVYATADRKSITLWTPEGEKTFVVQKGRSQLSSIKEGAPISVELNEAGNVIDIHKASVNVAIEANPKTKPGYHIKLNGTVSKIQSGLVKVQTPGASYTVSAKTAPPDIKVGDELSLWVNENNIVVDHHRKGDKMHHHRFITGKLTYASPEKNEIKLWTPEGEKTFDVQTGRSKLSTIEEGTAITVEINEAGNVIDIRKTS
jgi:uncharacterized protein YuzE